MEGQIGLIEIFQILKRRIGIILATTIALAVIAGLVSTRKNQSYYTSTATLLAGNERKVKLVDEEGREIGEITEEKIIDFGHSLISDQRARFYKELLDGKKFLSELVDRIDEDISIDRLRGALSLEVPEDSAIIKIKAKDQDLANIDKILDEAVAVFRKQTQEIMGAEDIIVLDPATSPSLSNSRNTKKDLVLGIGGGLIVGIFLAFLVDFTDDRVKGEEDIEELGLNIVGRGRSQEDLKILGTNLQVLNRYKGQKIITILSSEEGRGELSAKLALFLAKEGRKVLLVDRNLEDSYIREDLQENKNLHILGARSREEDPSLLGDSRIRETLDQERENYDYIIVDSYPIYKEADSLVLASLADRVLVEVDRKSSRIKDLKVTKKSLEELGLELIDTILV